MSSLDVCATVGCNHRRDEHATIGRTECLAGWGDGTDEGCMVCFAFTEPPTVAEHDDVKFLRETFDSIPHRVVFTKAEHDDNLDLEAIRADYELLPEDLRDWFAVRMIPALLAALDAERAKNTEALAKAWDEGRATGKYMTATNPYRILGGKD